MANWDALIWHNLICLSITNSQFHNSVLFLSMKESTVSRESTDKLTETQHMPCRRVVSAESAVHHVLCVKKQQPEGQANTQRKSNTGCAFWLKKHTRIAMHMQLQTSTVMPLNHSGDLTVAMVYFLVTAWCVLTNVAFGYPDRAIASLTKWSFSHLKGVNLLDGGKRLMLNEHCVECIRNRNSTQYL